MCKKKVSSEKGNAEEQSQTNVGLLNIASENFGGGLNPLEVLEIISFAILTMLLIRWCKKWCKGRRARKLEGLKCVVKEASSMEMGKLPHRMEPSAPVQPAILALPPPAAPSAPAQPAILALPPPASAQQIQLGSRIMQNYQA